MIRDKDSGKSKGFCFLCYEDQRSTVLAVDNFNGIKIMNRTIRVDHVSNYKVPKEGKKTDAETKKLYQEGCAPKVAPVVPEPEKPTAPPATPSEDWRYTLADQIVDGVRLPPRLPIDIVKKEKLSDEEQEKKEEKVDVAEVKKKKKEKKHKKKSKKKKKSDSDSDNSDGSSEDERKRRKRKREDKERRHKR